MFAALAQLVEQRFCKAKVLSSSLRSGSNNKKYPHTCGYFLLLDTKDLKAGVCRHEAGSHKNSAEFYM
ncbi:MAG: hypothetical protein RL687_237 [Candidatus Parcubacteria bacterium]